MKKILSIFILLFAVVFWFGFSHVVMATAIYNDSDMSVFVASSNICSSETIKPGEKLNCAHKEKGHVEICYKTSHNTADLSMTLGGPQDVYCEGYSSKTNKCRKIGYISIYGNKHKKTKHTPKANVYCVYYWKPGKKSDKNHTFYSCIDNSDTHADIVCEQ